MKNKILVLLIILLLFISSCGKKEVKENTQKEEPKIIFNSTDDLYSLETDDTWKQLEKGSINSQAVLEISGKELLKYGLILSDDKKHFTNYDSWYNSVSPRLSKGYKYDIDKVEKTSVNGYNAKTISFKTNVNEYEFYMSIYFIEGKDHFIQLLLYAPYSEKEYVEKEFVEIANSFNEI